MHNKIWCQVALDSFDFSKDLEHVECVNRIDKTTCSAYTHLCHAFLHANAEIWVCLELLGQFLFPCHSKSLEHHLTYCIQ